MSLANILDEKIIVTDLDETTKEQALTRLSKALYDNGYVSDIPSFLDDIYYRESLGPTGIGNFIAIPHGQSESVLKNGIAIGKFNKIIPWETLDDKGVKLIFLFSVNSKSDGANEHLKLLASLAGKLGNDEIVNKLLKAKSTQEIMSIFIE